MSIIKWMKEMLGIGRKEVQKTEENLVQNVESKEMDTEKMDRVIAYIKEYYSKPVVKIMAMRSNNLSITDSKFGGFPYWEKGREPIRTPYGNKMDLLAQINFEKAGINNPLFPKKGILQFFIEPDELYGLDFDAPAVQNSFKVIYHPEVDETVTIDDVIEADIRAEDGSTPLEGAEYCLVFQEGTEHLGMDVREEFAEAVAEAYKVLFQEEIEGDLFEYLSDEELEYLHDALYTHGHKMLGYPNFTQDDPRWGISKERFDTLLLQIDSEDGIMWGDSGIGNFFINHENLKNLDFSSVLYNWDCC